MSSTLGINSGHHSYLSEDIPPTNRLNTGPYLLTTGAIIKAAQLMGIACRITDLDFDLYEAEANAYSKTLRSILDK